MKGSRLIVRVSLVVHGLSLLLLATLGLVGCSSISPDTMLEVRAVQSMERSELQTAIGEGNDGLPRTRLTGVQAVEGSLGQTGTVE